MRPLVKNQQVKYVAHDGKTILDATIIEPLSPTTARLEIGDNAHALAAYNEDQTTANTFHFPDEDDGKAAKKSFAPGKGSPGNSAKPEPVAA